MSVPAQSRSSALRVATSHRHCTLDAMSIVMLTLAWQSWIWPDRLHSQIQCVEDRTSTQGRDSAVSRIKVTPHLARQSRHPSKWSVTLQVFAVSRLEYAEGRPCNPGVSSEPISSTSRCPRLSGVDREHSRSYVCKFPREVQHPLRPLVRLVDVMRVPQSLGVMLGLRIPLIWKQC